MSTFHTAGTNYTIHTEVYDGPLDLLLDLITKAELEITKVSLAKVTDQYLDYLERMRDHTATEVSSFLVIAAKLIQIKSEALLPRPPVRDIDEEDPAESLARQLRIYQSIKESAQWFRQLEANGRRTYIRLAPPRVVDDQLDLSDVGVPNLVELMKALFRYEEDAIPLTSVVAIPRVTIKNKIRDLIYFLRKDKRLSYSSILSENHSRIEAIILFLAILELIKQDYAIAEQSSLFADINISATDRTYNNEDIKLALDD